MPTRSASFIWLLEAETQVFELSSFVLLTVLFLDTLQLIVNTNTDLNVIDGKGQTPLHISTKYGFTNNVSLLCKHNAMLHIQVSSSTVVNLIVLNYDQDQEGHTVYHLAASQGRTEILSILLEALSAENKEQ
jgi:ankyrin repeat protein